MEILKEPEGVDFVIKSRILTENEEKALSAYIAKWKIENKKQSANNKKSRS
jgi:hypothetical protein